MVLLSSMKNMSVFLNCTQNTHNLLQSSDCGLNHRHGRTYGPLIGLFLASLLNKAVAKYAASNFLPITYPPWSNVHHKPVNYISYNQLQQHSNLWQPASPYLHGLTAFAEDYHHDNYSPTEHFDIHDVHPTELSPTPPNEHALQDETHSYQAVATSIESPDVSDQISSQSQVNYRRQRPPYRWPQYNFSPRRENQNRLPYDNPINRNPVNRYRPTTPYYDYNYDNYDEPTTRFTPYRTKRPTFRRKPVNNYDYSYENSEYDDSYYDDVYTERTTKPYKRRRKPTKKNRFKKRKDESEEDFDNSESRELSEEKDSIEKAKEKEVKVKQRQQQTTTTTTTESETTTETTTATTEQSTMTPSSSATSANQNTSTSGYGPGGPYENISFTYGPPVVSQQYGPPYNVQPYGYGPSRGNEAVSITYSPPIFPIFQHNYPYSHWIPQEATKNAIIQKVHDIVGFDEDFVNRA